MVPWHDFDDNDAFWWLNIYIYLYIYLYDDIVLITNMVTWLLTLLWLCHEVAYGHGIYIYIYDDGMTWDHGFTVMVT